MYPHRFMIVCTFLFSLATLSVQAGLMEYVQRPDPNFMWEERGMETREDGTIYDLYLVSQVWQGITWEHQLQVYLPNQIKYPDTMLLFNVGGEASEDDIAFGLTLAKLTSAPCAILYHIPNQPLFDGKKEDELIAYTFDKYIETGDEDWPLLFPMTKSLVKAMDALQAFSKKRLTTPIEGFVVSGASKRGWTSWLTAVVDPRVKAIVPLVIDMLNLFEQMPHQLELWGTYSEEIDDYTRRGMQEQMETERGRYLFNMVDPYTYREQLTLPKLLVIGTNDRYWTLDAMNLYWDDLRGPKYVLYVPNSGHGLEDRQRATAGLTAFFRFIASGQPLPQLSWQYLNADGKLRLILKATPIPEKVQLWYTDAPARDFRSSHWEATPLAEENGTFTGEVAFSPEKYVALFGEFLYQIDGFPCYFSTQVRLEPPLPQTGSQTK